MTSKMIYYYWERESSLPIIVTDPPFNVGYHYNTYKDNLEDNEYLDLIYSVTEKLHIPYVLIHYPEELYKISLCNKNTPTKVCSWVYNSNTPKQHRDIAYFNVKPNFAQIKQPYKNVNDKRITERIKDGKMGCNLYDWYYINQVKNISKEKTEHPCQMPLEVMKNVIGVLPKDSIIIDPFMGSNTTGVACKLLNYNYIGIELDSKYFEIAKERIEKPIFQQNNLDFSWHLFNYFV